jgi:radical SAM protein with 4Fe4S-binding SPASM domain
LNKNLLYFAARCSEHGIRSQVDSNLNLREISDDEADAIVRSGLGQICGSIDGATQESYVQYRRRGKIDRALRNLSQIVEAKKRLGSQTPDVGWNYLVNRFNEHEIDQARRMAREIGVHIEFKLMSCWDPSWESSFHRTGVLPSSDDGVEAANAATPTAAADGEAAGAPQPIAVRAPQEPPLPPITKSENRGLPMPLSDLRLHPELPSWCMQPFTFMVLNWDGKVMPCCTVHGDEYAIGNLVTDSLEDVWSGVQFRSARKFLYNFGEPQNTGSVCERLPCPVNPKHARSARSLPLVNSP